MRYIVPVLAAVHVLASAAWFGAMVYSLTILHPRAKRYFASDEEFEQFIATLAQGARWKVLAGLAVIGVTGAALVWLRWSDERLWLVLMAAKALLFAAAVCVFCYTSWILWPRRVLAAPEEVPGLQRAFKRVAVSLIAIAGAAFAMGTASQFLR
jgi:uncharacterized membrane protein